MYIDCDKCRHLFELYDKALTKNTKTNARIYWVMTELFVLLHGDDTCHDSQYYDVIKKTYKNLKGE